MFAGARFPKSAWLLAVAVAACALMVLPGGTYLAGVQSEALHGSLHIGGPTSLPTARVGPVAAHSTLPGAVPASLAKVPWISALSHPNGKLRPLTSLPNFALLQHPLAPNGTVNPFYVAQPAPLGLTDYGLGATPYSYNVSRLMGQVTLTAPPNMTDPASTGVIEPGGAADGFVGSVNEFGVQLNTVATNMSIPGSDQAFFWTQNVINWNDTGIHFVDDTFNLTSATQSPFAIQPGTIYSACGTTGAGVTTILTVYGGVFQCVGGTVPISPASYPITVQLYNNASVNSHQRTQVTYGYRIVETGTGTVVTGISDAVVFNSPGAPSTPPVNKPGYSIDAFGGAPAGLFRDAEMDLVGDIGGDNAVFRSISGSIQLMYTNATHGGWANVPSAYNFGGDTGETSAGIADYWTASHVLVINQGPAMLYGLWNAAPWASVPVGAIHFSGSVAPTYALVFVGNSHPVTNPFGTGLRDNMSWLPTTNAGTFSTWLPPVGAWAAKYYVQAFADGYKEKNGTSFHATAVEHLHMSSSPGTLNAPLAAWTNLQMSALANAVTGSSAPPYVFNGLVVNMNFTFEHVNDYGFAEFEVLQTQGVTNPIFVNNTIQGSDSPSGNRLIYDYASSGSSGVLTPGPFNTSSSPYATSGINIFDGLGDRVSNQTTAAFGYGLAVNLWQDSGAKVWDIVSTDGSIGVWVGDSNGTTVWNVAASVEANGVTDVGSHGTTATTLSSNGAFSYAYDGESSAFVTVSHVVASAGAKGVVTGQDSGAGAAYDPYYYLPGVDALSASWITATGGSTGANLSLSTDTVVSHVFAANGSSGVQADLTMFSDYAFVTVHNGSTGVWMTGCLNITTDVVHAVDNSTAVGVVGTVSATVDNTTASLYSVGVYV
ncbi:MAG: thermopsin, partial [Thermoplasmata archaeon]|nr:thermopsin [Thermoplasmata archaeon]